MSATSLANKKFLKEEVGVNSKASDLLRERLPGRRTGWHVERERESNWRTELVTENSYTIMTDAPRCTMWSMRNILQDVWCERLRGTGLWKTKQVPRWWKS